MTIRMRSWTQKLVRDNTRRYLSGAPLNHVVSKPDGTLQGFAGNP